MGVRILASNTLQKAKGQLTTSRKHYIDLEFNVCQLFLLHILFIIR
jgi:hypothetical protein